jgi:hypothetical protein
VRSAPDWRFFMEEHRKARQSFQTRRQPLPYTVKIEKDLQVHASQLSFHSFPRRPASGEEAKLLEVTNHRCLSYPPSYLGIFSKVLEERKCDQRLRSKDATSSAADPLFPHFCF